VWRLTSRQVRSASSMPTSSCQSSWLPWWRGRGPRGATASPSSLIAVLLITAVSLSATSRFGEHAQSSSDALLQQQFPQVISSPAASTQPENTASKVGGGRLAAAPFPYWDLIFFLIPFLPRDAVHKHGLSGACLSVTFVYFVETVKDTATVAMEC